MSEELYPRMQFMVTAVEVTPCPDDCGGPAHCCCGCAVCCDCEQPVCVPLSLAECPIGLFLHGNTLGLKTEYSNNEGRIDAYIVESGEFFCGDQPQTVASQRSQMVVPLQVVAERRPADAELDRLRGENERLREGLPITRGLLVASLETMAPLWPDNQPAPEEFAKAADAAQEYLASFGEQP